MPTLTKNKNKDRTLSRQPEVTSNTNIEESVPVGQDLTPTLNPDTGTPMVQMAGPGGRIPGTQPEQPRLLGRPGVATGAQGAATGIQEGAVAEQEQAQPQAPPQAAQQAAQPVPVAGAGAAGVAGVPPQAPPSRQKKADEAIVKSYTMALAQAQAAGNAQAVANINRVLQSDRYSGIAQTLQAQQVAATGPPTDLPPTPEPPTGAPGAPGAAGPEAPVGERTLTQRIAFPSHALVTSGVKNIPLAGSAGRGKVVAEVGEKKIVQTDVIGRMRRESTSQKRQVSYDEALQMIRQEAESNVQRMENLKDQRAERQNRATAVETERKTAEANITLAKEQLELARKAEARAGRGQKKEHKIRRKALEQQIKQDELRLKQFQQQQSGLKGEAVKRDRAEREQWFQNDLDRWTDDQKTFKLQISDIEKEMRGLLKDDGTVTGVRGATLDTPPPNRQAEFNAFKARLAELKKGMSTAKRPRRSRYMTLSKEPPGLERDAPSEGAVQDEGASQIQAPATPQAGAVTTPPAAPETLKKTPVTPKKEPKEIQTRTSKSGIGFSEEVPVRTEPDSLTETVEQPEPSPFVTQEQLERTLRGEEGEADLPEMPSKGLAEEGRKRRRKKQAEELSFSDPQPVLRAQSSDPKVQQLIDENPDRYVVMDSQGQLKILDTSTRQFVGDYTGEDVRFKSQGRDEVHEAIEEIFPDYYKDPKQLAEEKRKRELGRAKTLASQKPEQFDSPAEMEKKSFKRLTQQITGEEALRSARAKKLAPLIGKEQPVSVGAGKMKPHEFAEDLGKHFVGKLAPKITAYESMGPDQRRDAMVNFMLAVQDWDDQVISAQASGDKEQQEKLITQGMDIRFSKRMDLTSALEGKPLIIRPWSEDVQPLINLMSTKERFMIHRLLRSRKFKEQQELSKSIKAIP